MCRYSYLEHRSILIKCSPTLHTRRAQMDGSCGDEALATSYVPAAEGQGAAQILDQTSCNQICTCKRMQ